MRAIAQFASEAQIQAMRCRFSSVGIPNQIAHAEFACRGTHGKRVHRLPACPEIIDSRQNDLSSRKIF